jgi:hypothetical protein
MKKATSRWPLEKAGSPAAPLTASKSVLGLVDQLVLGDPRHHGAQLATTTSIGDRRSGDDGRSSLG